MRVIKKNGATFRVHSDVPRRDAADFAGPDPVFLRRRLKQFWDDVESDRWEADTFKVLRRFLDKEHSYIDLGAWIGPTLLYGCQLAKRGHGVEPDPVAYQALSANVELNPELKEKIALTRACIADVCGSVRLGNEGDFWGDSTSSMLFEHPPRSQEVEALTFGDFLERHQIDDCNLIKMDIEGAEAIVLPNMCEYLRRVRPTLHVSLHVSLIHDRLDEIFEVLSLYKYVLSETGERLDLDYLRRRAARQLHPYDRLVVTDREWGVAHDLRTSAPARLAVSPSAPDVARFAADAPAQG